jgi:hypothetical protein
MSALIRIVKRGQREGTDNAVDNSRVVPRTTPEEIVKNWITSSRERRKAEAEEVQRSFRRWDENLSLS